jgi:hypothetical protein
MWILTTFAAEYYGHPVVMVVVATFFVAGCCALNFLYIIKNVQEALTGFFVI